MSQIGIPGRQETDADDTDNTMDVIGSFIQTSAILQKQFKQICIRALSYQKTWQVLCFSASGIHCIVFI